MFQPIQPITSAVGLNYSVRAQEQYKLEPSGVFYGSAMIYIPALPTHRGRLAKESVSTRARASERACVCVCVSVFVSTRERGRVRACSDVRDLGL